LFPPSMGLLLLLLPLSAGSAAAAAAAAATTAWRLLACGGQADASGCRQLLLHGAGSWACCTSRVLSCCAALCPVLHPSCGLLLAPPAAPGLARQARCCWWCLARRGCAAWPPVANILARLVSCSCYAAYCCAMAGERGESQRLPLRSVVAVVPRTARGQPKASQYLGTGVLDAFCTLISARCCFSAGTTAAAVHSAFCLWPALGEQVNARKPECVNGSTCFSP
jgi:hypothetical protein